MMSLVLYVPLIMIYLELRDINERMKSAGHETDKEKEEREEETKS